ncbi:MarR family winged helix-turn-helix transcriptional regulator [Hyphomicrobiaceae bacterium 22]|uniref:MarR family winged helix-turn-helix transcriptional regulator n=2 Tax=Prosthecodimorpha staleyi TaxID=2840188 RepID=A0A947D7U8_9HYPH|nr:MarR family winged helix-turn-helix transcriptional regulator [Prosthecodimorpha staleyi]
MSKHDPDPARGTPSPDGLPPTPPHSDRPTLNLTAPNRPAAIRTEPDPPSPASRPSPTTAALPGAGEGARGAAGHLGYLLRQAAHVFRQRIDQALGAIGLTAPQFSVLTMLAAYPGHSNADLARLALLTPQTMSVIVANLAAAGLIVARPHPVHGRIRRLALTEAGRSALAAAKTRVYALETALLGGLPETDEAVIRRWLAGVAAGAGSGAGETSDPD